METAPVDLVLFESSWSYISIISIRQNKLIFKSNTGKSFNQEQAIDLLVSLVATDPNSQNKWRGFYNSLSSTELQDECDENWKT